MGHSGQRKQMTILRATGAAVSLVLRSALPVGYKEMEGELRVVKGFSCDLITCPVVEVVLSCFLVNDKVKLANDLAGGHVLILILY